MDASSLERLAEMFSQIADPRKPRGVRHPFPAILSLVFLGLLARITEMAVVTRWASAHWDELKGPLGFTREKPPCDHDDFPSAGQAFSDRFSSGILALAQVGLGRPRGRWAAAIDGKTCCQGLDTNGVARTNAQCFSATGKIGGWINGRSAATKPTNLEVSKIIFPNY